MTVASATQMSLHIGAFKDILVFHNVAAIDHQVNAVEKLPSERGRTIWLKHAFRPH